MSFPKYPKYKPCDLPSQDEMPSHWEIRPNRSFLSLTKSMVADAWREMQLLSLTLRGIVLRDIESGDGKYPADFGTYQVVNPKDLVFCLFDVDETPRTVGVSRYLGMITSAYDVFRCGGDADSDFIHYYYLHIDSFKALRPYYTGLRKVVRPSTFLSLRIPLPPYTEQTAIAAFLDRETSKIDELVAEQRRLIELLKEKRQAVISHAVTKGLNPSAPMKPSGIPWLGDVPAHWEVKPLKAMFDIKHGYAFDGRFFSDSGEMVLMTPGNFLERGGYRPKDPEKYYCGLDVLDEFILVAGDLLVALTEQAPGLLGSALFVPASKTFLHNQRIGRIKDLQSDKIDDRFLYFLFNSIRIRAAIANTSTGSKVQHTSPQKILSLNTGIPPISEQKRIVKYIESETERVDSLTAEAERAIELLQERRTALISAAVTGKIDVRSVVTGEVA